MPSSVCHADYWLLCLLKINGLTDARTLGVPPPRLHFVMFGLNSHFVCTFYREMRCKYVTKSCSIIDGMAVRICKNIFCYCAAIQITDGNTERISAHGSPEASGCRSSSPPDIRHHFCLLLASRTTWPSSPIIAAVVAHQANVCFTGALRQWE